MANIKVTNSPRYQIKKTEEVCFSMYATTFYYKVIFQNDNGDLFIVPTRTKKTGKEPTFRGEAQLAVWVRKSQMEIVE